MLWRETCPHTAKVSLHVWNNYCALAMRGVPESKQPMRENVPEQTPAEGKNTWVNVGTSCPRAGHGIARVAQNNVWVQNNLRKVRPRTCRRLCTKMNTDNNRKGKKEEDVAPIA